MKRTDIKKRPLSDTTLENLEAENTLYREKDSENLYFQVKPTGAKSWVMRYKKANGKWSWHGLGAYPRLTGANARKLYREKLAELANGAQALQAKQLDPNAKTFKAVAMEWYQTPKIQALAPDTKEKYLIHINHACKRFGNTPIYEITRATWLDFLLKLQSQINPKTGKPTIETANRTLQTCSRIYRFAISHEIAGVAHNPLDHMHERLQKHESEPMAHVSEEELPKLLSDITTINSPTIRIGIQLLAHLFLRPNEVLNGQWSEIDFDKCLWEIPAHRMKKRRTHLVPLSSQVIALLTELKILTGESGVLFPHKAKNSKNAHARFRKALKQLGYAGKQDLHGFRHIASTKLNEYSDNGIKFDERVIEFALAHKVQGVKGVYNKAEYLQDRKALNEWYSNFLESQVMAGMV